MLLGITARRAAMLGVFSALAAATKDQPAGLFMIVPLVCMIPSLAPDVRQRPCRSE
jgi:hypothetical protein